MKEPMKIKLPDVRLEGIGKALERIFAPSESPSMAFSRALHRQMQMQKASLEGLHRRLAAVGEQAAKVQDFRWGGIGPGELRMPSLLPSDVELVSVEPVRTVIIIVPQPLYDGQEGN
jgi:hypothetical protein